MMSPGDPGACSWLALSCLAPLAIEAPRTPTVRRNTPTTPTTLGENIKTSEATKPAKHHCGATKPAKRQKTDS